MLKKNKIIVILGLTASGKSNIAVKLAKKLGGEVISADSRQVYRHMNIGTGKITKNEMREVRHWMLDIVSPKTDYNVAKFKKAVDKIIYDILERGKVPIICGGTGFWIKAIVDNVKFPEVKPNWKLRQKLNKQSILQLFELLKCLDPQRARVIDRNNKVRLIRAIEICKTIGKVPLFNDLKKLGFSACRTGRSRPQQPKEAELLKFLQLGISLPKEKLYKNIKKRLEARFRQGMIREVKNLHFKYGVSWKRLESFGLEYKWIALYLQNKLTKQEMEDKLLQEIKNYSKRQMTWFKKDKRIKWVKDSNAIEKKIKELTE